MPSGTAVCVGKVLGTVYSAMRTLCTTTDPTACLANLVDQLNDLLVAVCTKGPLGPTTSDAVATCTQMVMDIVDAATAEACNSDSSGAEAMDDCLVEVERLLDTLQREFYETACPNSPYGVIDMCYEEIRDGLLELLPSTDPCSYLILICNPPPLPGGLPPLGLPCDATIELHCMPLELRAEILGAEPNALVVSSSEGVLRVPKTNPADDPSVSADGSGTLTSSGAKGELGDDGTSGEAPSAFGHQYDSRVRVTDPTKYPYRAIAQLEMAGGGVCSGFLYGRNVVATAAHCLLDSYNQRRSDFEDWVRVIPGRNGPLKPFDQCHAAEIRVSAHYFYNRDAAHDWGAIKLDCSVGRRVGWFALKAITQNARGNPAILVGYPADNEDHPDRVSPNTQWKSLGQIDDVETYKYWYHNDASGGQSGSPLYDLTSSCSCVTAFGIHSGWNGSFFNVRNRGTRIIESNFRALVAFKNEG